MYECVHVFVCAICMSHIVVGVCVCVCVLYYFIASGMRESLSTM